MLPSNIANTIDTISPERIRSYRSYFNLTTDEEALGLYLWNDALSASFFKLVSILEVTFRNALHRELSHEYHPHKNQGSVFDNDWYEYLISQNLLGDPKFIRKVTHLNSRGRTRPKRPIPKPGDVIAGQTFGFWPSLIDRRNINWQKILHNALKDHYSVNQSYWNQSSIDDLILRLKQVCELRNRIAHHEPIWKFTRIIHRRSGNEIYPAARTPEDSLSRMIELNKRLVRLLSWVSEDRKMDYLDSHYKRHFDWLVTGKAIETYKTLQLREGWKLSKVKRELRKLLVNGIPVEVIHKGNSSIIIPGII
ncbi:Abi family protein [Colwellia sp. UCD-KL20]|uniref:Abi family protein n=1 Tax=Colwellia sp. UCD-KL20 TaxID=1917165 RepID=UPI0009707F81|nr:Abi family protein [Colwellia sp. UCD-KL20]